MHSSVVYIPLAILRVRGATSGGRPPMVTISGWHGGGVAKIRTVSLAEKRNSRDPLCFPMTTASVLLNQICADWLMVID